MRYLHNCLTDCDEIWSGDAYSPSQANEQQKFENFKIQDEILYADAYWPSKQ